MTTQLAPDYPQKVVCAVLNYARSSYYYRPEPPDDEKLKAAIHEVAGQFPTLRQAQGRLYGYRRMTAELRRGGWQVNRKRVARLMGEMGLQAKIKAKTRRTTDSDHPFPRYANLVQDLVITHPDHLWVADLTYVRLGREFVYLAVLMDVFTRSIRGWHLGRSLEQDLTLTALRQALT